MISDDIAIALLPLATEYQIECLQKLCGQHFLRDTYSSHQFVYQTDHTPKLEMLTLADIHHLRNLKEKLTIKCAARLDIEEIKRQKLLPENKTLSDEAFIKLLRLGICVVLH